MANDNNVFITTRDAWKAEFLPTAFELRKINYWRST